MKRFKHYLSYLALAAMVFTSCSKDEATDSSLDPGGDKATLTLGAVLNATINKSANKQSMEDFPDCSDTEPAWASISLGYDTDGADDTDGYDQTIDVTVGISQDAAGYFTLYDDELEIPIPSGETTVEVTLLDFMVYNDVADPLNEEAPGTLIWLAPKEGSDFAAYVDDALPMNFDLRAGSKNYVDVEVLCFDNRVVNKFGYQFFDINTTEMIQFCLFGNYCAPSGRHYTASYRVDVWEMDGEATGDKLYSETAEVEMDNGVAYADPLCFYLPDHADELDQFWFEITLLDSEQYDADNRVIIEGSISDIEIRELFNNDGTMEYYHFQYGCGEDVPPPFYDVEDEAEHFKTCIYSAEGSDAVGFAYFTKDGNNVRADIIGFELESGIQHPMYLHEGEDCEDVGDIMAEINLENGSFPIADSYGKIEFTRTWSLSSTFANSLHLADRTITINNYSEDGTYVVACGEIMEN